MLWPIPRKYLSSPGHFQSDDGRKYQIIADRRRRMMKYNMYFFLIQLEIQVSAFTALRISLALHSPQRQGDLHFRWESMARSQPTNRGRCWKLVESFVIFKGPTLQFLLKIKISLLCRLTIYTIWRPDQRTWQNTSVYCFQKKNYWTHEMNQILVNNSMGKISNFLMYACLFYFFLRSTSH